MYKITVKNNLGEVFAETEPLQPEDLPGILRIMDKPSMFGAKGFSITITRI